MPRNEEGEFELVLGNRQLLSVFFIVVVLLGVFFTMGYIVGRNSSGADLAKAREASSTIVVDKQADSARPEPSKPAPSTPAAETPAPAPAPAAAEPKPEQQPAKAEERQTAAAVPVKTAAPAKTEAPKAEAATREPAKTEAAAGEAAAGRIIEPAKGTIWLQVMAVGRTDAELMVNILRKKGFTATIAPSNSETLFRVLVGPLADSAAVSKTRAELKDAGFKEALVKKY